MQKVIILVDRLLLIQVGKVVILVVINYKDQILQIDRDSVVIISEIAWDFSIILIMELDSSVHDLSIVAMDVNFSL